MSYWYRTTPRMKMPLRRLAKEFVCHWSCEPEGESGLGDLSGTSHCCLKHESQFLC